MSALTNKSMLFVLILLAAGIGGLWGTRAAAPPAFAAEEKTVEPKKEKRIRLSDTTVRDAVRRSISYSGLDERASLREALNMLQKGHDVVIDIDEAAFKADGIDNVSNEKDGPEVASTDKPLPPIKATLGTVLEKVLFRVPARSAARFVIRKDRIEITTEAAIRRELGLSVPKLDEKKTNQLPLTPLVWDEFRDQRLDEILHELSSSMDVSILVDPRVESKAEKKLDAALRNVPIDTALELLADMAGLAVVKRTGAYYVTSPENAEKLRKSKP
jgi:hypothetical protein